MILLMILGGIAYLSLRLIRDIRRNRRGRMDLYSLEQDMKTVTLNNANKWSGGIGHSVYLVRTRLPHDERSHICQLQQIYTAEGSTCERTIHKIKILMHRDPEMATYVTEVWNKDFESMYGAPIPVAKDYAAIRIQRWWRRWRCRRAALVIQKGCHDWLHKPVCRDGTLGINLRLLLRESREMGLMAE
jgi:hypothetical protein